MKNHLQNDPYRCVGSVGNKSRCQNTAVKFWTNPVTDPNTCIGLCEECNEFWTKKKAKNRIELSRKEYEAYLLLTS